jgi:hypothetical protein
MTETHQTLGCHAPTPVIEQSPTAKPRKGSPHAVILDGHGKGPAPQANVLSSDPQRQPGAG